MQELRDYSAESVRLEELTLIARLSPLASPRYYKTITSTTLL